jgi:hypothetical protein
LSFANCTYEQIIQGENLQIGTMLTWSTSYEENTAMFIIEKSIDGSEFVEVGSVKCAGDSDDVKEYNFLDVMSNESKMFYRLRQVDQDGSFSYSEILAINQVYKNNFMVARMSAVATTDLFEVTIDAIEDGDLKYSLANWKGEVVLEDQVIVFNGLNELSIDLTDQRDGIYKLALNMEDEMETLVLKKIPDEITRKANMASKNKGLEKGKN